MEHTFSLSQFLKRFPDDIACFEEIKRLRYPYGIDCMVCRKITKYYRLKNRMAYSCKECRHQVYPLSGTIFQRSTTPLRLWFYALFLMTHTRAEMYAKDLQKELRVTYKTAWRMHSQIVALMKQNHGDLLSKEGKGSILRWNLFNTLEIKITQKQQ